jgi:hypothetical protein
MAFVLRHDAGDGVLIAPHDLTQLLGVQTARHLGRANEVAEHHCHLAAFGLFQDRAFWAVPV